MHAACRAGDVQKVRELLRAEPKLANDAAGLGRFPLHEAVAGKHADVVVVLIDAGAEIDVRTTLELSPRRGLTPLHMAVINGDRAIVTVLLNAKSDINALGSKTWASAEYTPLHYASARQDVVLIQSLLSRDADVLTVGSNHRTALHSALMDAPAVAKDLAVRRQTIMLLDAAVAVNQAESASGWTALHEAAERNWLGVANDLLRFGADASLKDKLGMTPRQVALRLGHTQIANRLQQAERAAPARAPATRPTTAPTASPTASPTTQPASE